MPTTDESARPIAEIIDELKQFRRGRKLDGITICDLVDENRRD
jgi:hypothetical protein